MLSEDSSAQPRRGLCVFVERFVVAAVVVAGGGWWVVVYFSMDKVLKKSISRFTFQDAKILTIFSQTSMVLPEKKRPIVNCSRAR